MSHSRFVGVIPGVASAALAAALLLPLVGCGRQAAGVRDYDEVLIPAPEPVQAGGLPAGPTAAAAAVAEPVAGPLTWQTPAGWTEQPGGGMRLGTFRVEGQDGDAECSIVSLSGEAGGLVSNVRRWIGQLGVEVPAADALDSFLSDQVPITTAGGHEGVVVDLTRLMEEHPPSAISMLVGIISRGEQTVFVKLTGSKSTLAEQRTNFEALCASLD